MTRQQRRVGDRMLADAGMAMRSVVILASHVGDPGRSASHAGKRRAGSI
jgi:hypothetical protein